MILLKLARKGLDPRIHILVKKMDCTEPRACPRFDITKKRLKSGKPDLSVKPGNDDRTRITV
jgi:hypothetical protein